jgi:hypothetical protein
MTRVRAERTQGSSPSTTFPASAASEAGDYGDDFPDSEKVYIEGPGGIQVPMRRISLSGGEPPPPGERHQRPPGP